MSSPEPIHAHAQSRDCAITTNAPSVVQFETSRLLPWLMLTCILSGFAVAFATFTFYQLTRSEREFKIWQLEVQNQSAILIREGLKQPTDLANGAAGNYQYEPRRK